MRRRQKPKLFVKLTYWAWIGETRQAVTLGSVQARDQGLPLGNMHGGGESVVESSSLLSLYHRQRLDEDHNGRSKQTLGRP